MDKKWDVFVEDDVAFLHQNWTGNRDVRSLVLPRSAMAGAFRPQ
jgi:hypothetical protein